MAAPVRAPIPPWTAHCADRDQRWSGKRAVKIPVRQAVARSTGHDVEVGDEVMAGVRASIAAI